METDMSKIAEKYATNTQRSPYFGYDAKFLDSELKELDEYQQTND